MYNSLKSIPFRIFIFLSFFFVSLSKAQIKSNLPDLPTYHFFYGPVYLQSIGSYTYDSIEGYYPDTKHALGLSIRLENSFILGYFIPQKNHKLRFGDRLVAGISVGGVNSTLNNNQSQLWGDYHFELGSIVEYNPNINIGFIVKWSFLVNEKDAINPNTSGSSLEIDLVPKPWLLGMNIVSLNQKIIGFLNPFLQPKNIGNIRYEGNLGYTFPHGKELKLVASNFRAPSNTLTLLKGLPIQTIHSSFSFLLEYGISF